MRARLGLAQTLWSLGRRDEAIGHCQALLELNANDNQGVRYVLASYYCDTSRDDELAQLLAQYPGDDTAEWLFSGALLAFRREGDTPHARDLLHEAHTANPHVAKYVLGHEQLPEDLPAFVQCGEETEAVAYATHYLSGWRATSGAVTWARQTLALPLPDAAPRRRASWAYLREAVSELPSAEQEVWQVDLRRAKIKGTRKQDLPWTFVVAEAGSDKLIALTGHADEKPKPDELLLDLLSVMRDPEDNEPRRPERVQVRLKALFRAWQAKLQSIAVECELCPELEHADQVLEVLEQHVSIGRLSADDVEQRTAELAELPQRTDETWQADMRKLGLWITGEGAPQRPWCVLVTSRNEDLILHQDVRMEAPSPAWLRQAVLAAMLAPMAGEPYRPGTVEVATDEFRLALAPELEPLGIGCVTREALEHVDFVFLDMEKRVAEPQQLIALIDTPGVTERQVAGFFDAAAEFYRKTPWRDVPSDVTIVVRCDKLQTNTWYAVVMGQSGMTLGLALYEDWEVLEAILRGDEDAQRRHSGLSITYGEAFEIAIRDLDAAERNGWPVAGPEAYPEIFRVNPGMAVRPPLAWELELTEACLRAVPSFLNRNSTTPARMAVPVANGELVLELTWFDR
jgi:tetratricopeptide (TPR) repeat protein